MFFPSVQDGRISISYLEPGTSITAKETKALDGYILDPTPQTIQIRTGEVQTLTFRNKKAGNLIIKKLDAKTQEPLPGVEFNTNLKPKALILSRQSKWHNPVLPTGSLFLLL